MSETRAMCDCIAIQEKPAEQDKEDFEYGFEKRLMNMAGANIPKDSREAATDKISKWWNKYKTLFRCYSISFNIENGSILKYSVIWGFKPFLENIVGLYNMDINFIDPADNRSLFDYVNDEIKDAIKELGERHPRVKVLKDYKTFIEELGGKPSK